jgi:bifunctional UDP-N-acetylglucosamine pyrophosphorylase/glucosamine-1-phosphate N-acetyltransferase
LDCINAVILAAGEGTRMKSKYSKVSHKLCGKPIVQHVIDTVKNAGIDNIIVVVGHNADQVKKCISTDVKFVLQEKQLGTGHAVMCSLDLLKDKDGLTLILYGDTPLVSKDTLSSLISYHKNHSLDGTILTADFDDPTGYGRIVRNMSGNVEKIVEHKDATIEEKRITEINSGMYCFNNQDLVNSLKYVKNDNAQREYYLTDVIGIMKSYGKAVGAYKTDDKTDIMGINSRVQLAEAGEVMKKRKNLKLMVDGVTMIDPNSTYIDIDVIIGKDTIIYPGTIIEGMTVIGEECTIGPNSRLTNCIIHDNVEVASSVVIESEICSGAHIGPFAYIRPESYIGESVKIGDFVEIKKSKIGSATKIPHLAYVGDAEIGENVNLGCGTITVNYDGKIKHKTIIGDNVFVGCNTNLVAPVKVNNDSYVAAGSTITDEVPKGALAIARERQVNKEGWVERKNMWRKRK